LSVTSEFMNPECSGRNGAIPTEIEAAVESEVRPFVNIDSSIISKMCIYIVLNVLYLYYTIYLTFLFYRPPALAMSCNWSLKNGATF
jgi:hypothetical protein